MVSIRQQQEMKHHREFVVDPFACPTGMVGLLQECDINTSRERDPGVDCFAE